MVNAPTEPMLSIAAVEQATGLGKDTLRVWERRYGFPQPARDAHGERAYPPEQVERLQLVARLLTAGLRPAKIVALPLHELQALQEKTAPTSTELQAWSPEVLTCLDLVKRHEAFQLRHTLNQITLRMGLARFVVELVGPLSVCIGDAWMRGTIQVFEEHLYTESMTTVLRNALSTIASPPGTHTPRVLLATVSKEPHHLGLLMAETIFTLNRCECLSLGVQTPLDAIAQAAVAQNSHIVALSFSSSLNGSYVVQALTDLRALLPAHMAIWAGGSHPALHRHAVPGVYAVPDLMSLPPMLEAWRALLVPTHI